MNTSYLLDDERKWLQQRYQPMVAKFRQLQREWVVVPFHHSADAVEYMRTMAEQFQALAARESGWRMTQYNLWWTSASETDDQEYAQFCRDQAREYLQESREWANEATDSRLLVQEMERARATYVAYQTAELALVATPPARVALDRLEGAS